MALHHAEQILKAVTTRLTGLTTTGSNVIRSRAYPLSAWPGVSVYQGDDNPQQEGNPSWSMLYSELTVYVDNHMRGIADADSELNAIRAEQTIALQSDSTLGLDFVIDLTEGVAEEPELNAEAEQPTLRQRCVWRVLYRRQREDPTQ